jgi:nucleotide-binding universal stress UspA family protein
MPAMNEAPATGGNQDQAKASAHMRKFLAVIDETEECSRAVRFASLRAEHTGSGVTLLYVIAPGDFQHWLNVETIRREEAMEEARETLSRFAREVSTFSKSEPELVTREGVLAEEIVSLINEDSSIMALVLAAADNTEGPGPLVSNLAGKAAGSFPVPIVIVPGNLSNAEIDRLA